MSKQYIISPSLLSANFAKLGESAAEIIKAGADWLHVDVMDNHYVPNLTFGPLICQALRDYGITVPLDVHLMIEPVDRIIPDFAKAGANYITFHPEATLHVHRTIQLIKDCGCKAGIALNPATPLEVLNYIWDDIDLILVMSVNPGFAAQPFLPLALNKLIELRKKIDSHKPSIRLAVDGGINLNTLRDVAKAGADTFIAGSALFSTSNVTKAFTDFQAVLDTLTQKQ